MKGKIPHPNSVVEIRRFCQGFKIAVLVCGSCDKAQNTNGHKCNIHYV